MITNPKLEAFEDTKPIFGQQKYESGVEL